MAAWNLAFKMMLFLKLGLVALVMTIGLRAEVPTDDQIRGILSERIDKLEQGIGIVVAVVDANGPRIVSHGRYGANDAQPMAADAVFEIGSCTKVFTATVLAIMVQRGEVSLDDPVAKHLPPSVKVPQRGGRQITLLDLATHTSGLPRSSADFAARGMENPYADYTVAELFSFLSAYELPRDIGSKYEYSNLGVALLGLALAHRAGADYESLVRTCITRPLSMRRTGIALSPEMQARMVSGHNYIHRRVSTWDMPAFEGAGALRSNAQDMITFLGAHLGYVESPFAGALAGMLDVRRPGDSPGEERALGWGITKRVGYEIVWHSGATGGYRSFIGYVPTRRVGVVVLSNVLVPSIEDIGMHLLDPTLPLAKLPPFVRRQEVALPPETLDRYAGVYQVRPGLTLTFTRDGSRFFSQVNAQRRFEMLAEGETRFFLIEDDAQVTFETDRGKRGVIATLHQGGRAMKAKRVERKGP